MPTHVHKEFQTRLFSILSGDAALVALLGGPPARIFDTAPDNVQVGDNPKPYIVIGDITLGDFGARDVNDFQGNFQVDVWSEKTTRLEAIEIMEKVYDLIQDTDLALPSFKSCKVRLSSSGVIPDPDNRTKHGFALFDVLFLRK